MLSKKRCNRSALLAFWNSLAVRVAMSSAALKSRLSSASRPMLYTGGLSGPHHIVWMEAAGDDVLDAHGAVGADLVDSAEHLHLTNRWADPNPAVAASGAHGGTRGSTHGRNGRPGLRDPLVVGQLLGKKLADGVTGAQDGDGQGRGLQTEGEGHGISLLEVEAGDRRRSGYRCRDRHCRAARRARCRMLSHAAKRNVQHSDRNGMPVGRATSSRSPCECAEPTRGM